MTSWFNRLRGASSAESAARAALQTHIDRLELDLSRARAALDNLQVGVVVVDATGSIVSRNARSHHHIASHGEVLVQEAIDRQLALALGGRSAQTAVELFGPPKRVFQVRATPLDDGGAIAEIEDISERARLEAVRTDFVANISHELKTPVGALAVLAEAVVDEPNPEVVQHLASRIVEEAHRAAMSIDDLLELSRIELGGDAVLEPVDVASLLSESIARSSAAAELQSIAVVVTQADDRLSLRGDRRQLQSAVGNLIDNAIKYSEPGGKVRVAAASDGDVIEISVSDQGIGIPARDLDRVFERFYRVDRARSRGTGGSGLGLAIVRHVATNHSGSVAAHSVEGEGSTFTFRIPVKP